MTREIEGFGKVEEKEDSVKKSYEFTITKNVKDGEPVENPEKVSFGKLGNMEFFTYPYRYPGTIWISTSKGGEGLAKMNDKYDQKKVFAILNRTRAYLKGHWKAVKFEEATKFQKKIIRAYNRGVEETFK